jgi:hypothetical protein
MLSQEGFNFDEYFHRHPSHRGYRLKKRGSYNVVQIHYLLQYWIVKDYLTYNEKIAIF